MTDYTTGDTIYRMFTTRATTGIPTTLAGTPVVAAYENDSVTQITAGITLGVDHDSVPGLNLLTIVATGANGFEAGKDYNMVITTGTVDSVSVVGEVVSTFSLERSAANTSVAALNDVAATDIVSAGAITTLSGAVVNVDLVDTCTTNTDMRGTDSAATAAALATVDTNVDAILVDTGTTLPASIAAVPTSTENADALLNRDMSAVSDTTARSPLNALRFLRNKWSVAGTTLTVTEEDDTTVAWTATLTTDAAADPVTGSDPA